ESEPLTKSKPARFGAALFQKRQALRCIRRIAPDVDFAAENAPESEPARTGDLPQQRFVFELREFVFQPIAFWCAQFGELPANQAGKHLCKRSVCLLVERFRDDWKKDFRAEIDIILAKHAKV